MATSAEDHDFLLPWEHRVCFACFQDNPYAVWLAKQRCVRPHAHRSESVVRVAIDPESLKLVHVRPLPPFHGRFSGNFQKCRHYQKCQYGSECHFAHSKVEADTWNCKKRILQEENTDNVKRILAADPDPQSPSEVCTECLTKYSLNALHLAQLSCIHPEIHQESTQTVVVNSSKACLIPVRDLPSRIRALDPQVLCLCWHDQDCRHGDRCTFPHSEEELNYWKWQRVKDLLKQMDGEFQELLEVYQYPTEVCVTKSVKQDFPTLSRSNYVSKYHKLVYLDELAHSRKMIQECNCEVNLCLLNTRQGGGGNTKVQLRGISSAAIDYAIHGHAEVELLLPTNEKYITTIEYQDEASESLVVKAPPSLQGKVARDQVQTAYAHFEINHKYFLLLQQAVHYADSTVLEKLIPSMSRSLQPTQRRVGLPCGFPLDEEYQKRAFQQMLTCNNSIPYILLGPFGTGKTHVLAGVVLKLLEDARNRVLVATHQNIAADSLYRNLQKYDSRVHTRALRLVPNDKVKQSAQLLPGVRSTCKARHEVSSAYLGKWSVIITTFLTALNLRKLVEHTKFTHILIDEGAQSREPEALGALVLAKRSTKVIIVGDNQQIGPQVSVLSDTARSCGLGTSVIERLHSCYKEHKRPLKTHKTTLLTNYRSHPSILMLASSLLYECTLLSRSNSQAHPDAPFPLMFLCTSLNQERLANHLVKDEAEAELLVVKMLEFVRTWPRAPGNAKPTIGLLASTRQQVTCLRKVFRQKVPYKERQRLPCEVDIKATYLIQGEEFSGIFLSTCEPTDNGGNALDPVRSICNEHVFNTLITRARSLVYVAGNPFMLCQMGTKRKTNCWDEFIHRCIQCQSLIIPKAELDQQFDQLPQTIEQLLRKVFPVESLDKATQLSLEPGNVNDIVKEYITTLQHRPEYKRAYKLVQDPTGRTTWETETTSGSDEEESSSSTAVLCRIDCENFHTAKAIPMDSGKPIELASYASRKLAMHGDVVRVDLEKQCVLLDKETEEAVSRAHFGESFLCKVDQKSAVMFLPLDRRHPKFANLPTLTSTSIKGVVCFDPRSIKDRPRINNFIPLKCARKMTFIVKFLGWQERFMYPLGIIVGALPSGHSPFLSDVVRRIANNIPLVPHLLPSLPLAAYETDSGNTQFLDAFTIDPEGSCDHDDALTCTQLSIENGIEVYEVGVHISNVHKLIPKGSPLDTAAQERGCSVYSSPDHCIAPMFPDNIVQATSLLEGQLRDTYSVLITVYIREEVVFKTTNVSIKASVTKSVLELTYPEAQAIMFNDASSTVTPSVAAKVHGYNQACTNNKLTINKKLQVLWNVALLLRTRRLKEAANAFPEMDPADIGHPEAHFLVEEFMVWANQEVASFLLRALPDSALLRTQANPSGDQFETLVQNHGRSMATSLHLRRYTRQQQPCDSISVLQSVLEDIQRELKQGSVRRALNYIQFEHLHAELAVAHSLFRQVQSPSNYCVAQVEDQCYSHDSLQCSQYTHFTSPIRRYIDVVIQRLLHAVLRGCSTPYTAEELNKIGKQCQRSHKQANQYERDMSKMNCAADLLQSSKELVCFVTQVEEGRLHLCFKDRMTFRAPSVSLNNLGASRSSRQLSETREGSHTDTRPEGGPSFVWEVRMASFTGTSLFHPKLELCKPEENDAANLTVDVYVDESQGSVQQSSNLIERRLHARLNSLACTVPVSLWQNSQACLKQHVPESKASEALSQICAYTNPPTENQPVMPQSALYVMTIKRPIQPYEAVRVQMSATHRDQTIMPSIQLLEVGPGVRVCIQHNTRPAECFTDKLTEKATQRHYKDVKEYFQRWEPVILAEAAHNSLRESEFFLVRDVTLRWPELTKIVSSTGEVYYQLVVAPGKNGVEMKIPQEFIQSSYDFFKFSEGDLACVRYDIPTESKPIHCVFHMVICHVERVFEKHETKKKLKTATAYLKFVGPTSNYISCKVEKHLRKLPQCEIQLISLTLPYRRIYRSLHDFTRYPEGNELAVRIALGNPEMVSTCSRVMERVLPEDQSRLATSLWPLQRQTHGHGYKRLNKFQMKAVNLAFENKLVLIQGPPGTGKSVTGAHIAYALAMKLKKESSGPHPTSSSDDLTPCVMYCGPTQQSVNVVFDMLISGELTTGEDLRVLRVFSKAIEQKDFPGPKQNKLFRQEQANARCEERHRTCSLHHLIRKRNPQIALIEDEFRELQSRGRIPSSEQRERYRAMIRATESKVIAVGADVILCTCNEASSHRVMESLRPVYCIIDECAMATEPECMVPIRRAEHVILIGDHQQLQPVIQYREAAEMGLQHSLFERYVEKVKLQPHMLEMQYRMHPELCRFPSAEFYDKKLVTDGAVAEQRRREVHQLDGFWPQAGKPFVFCDTVGKEVEIHTGQSGSTEGGPGSKYNAKEARKIVSILQTLTNAPYRIARQEIAVLTPYLAQRSEIKKQLRQSHMEDFTVKTITESQGSEYGIVVLSMVRSQPIDSITTSGGRRREADIGWRRSNLGFITDRHQICVGITRCKYGLIIVGNRRLLEYDQTWNRLITHYMSKGCVKRERDFPPRREH